MPPPGVPLAPLAVSATSVADAPWLVSDRSPPTLPAPALTDTAPPTPLDDPLLPADSDTAPPVAPSPEPTPTDTAPPALPDDAPVDSEMEPEPLAAEEPELTATAPLVPDDPL